MVDLDELERLDPVEQLNAEGRTTERVRISADYDNVYRALVRGGHHRLAELTDRYPALQKVCLAIAQGVEIYCRRTRISAADVDIAVRLTERGGIYVDVRRRK